MNGAKASCANPFEFLSVMGRVGEREERSGTNLPFTPLNLDIPKWGGETMELQYVLSLVTYNQTISVLQCHFSISQCSLSYCGLCSETDAYGSNIKA